MKKISSYDVYLKTYYPERVARLSGAAKNPGAEVPKEGPALKKPSSAKSRAKKLA